MGFQDRSYSRRPGPNPWGALQWLVSGSLPLFTFAGIRVRAHASMVILIALVLLFGMGPGFTAQDRIISMSVLFLIVLLHEFGHCFAARAVGGSADDILMTPLGGLAYASPPRRPLPTFITVACGPLVNVLLMLGAAVLMYGLGGKPSWNPFSFSVQPEMRAVGDQWLSVFFYAAWFFSINYWLLLFNLIPSFPLDGGQLLQAALWRPLGYYRSMIFAVTVGIVGGGAMIALGLVSGRLILTFVGLSCLMNCVSMRRQLKSAGPWGFQEEDSDYSAAGWKPDSVEQSSRGEERQMERARQKAAQRAAEEANEQRNIDQILAKVGREGMQSLSFFEKRALKTATEKQRQRTLRGRR